MKKILILICLLFLITGCDDLTNTPKKQVEVFFNKYQTLDKDVLEDLDSVVAEEATFTEAQKDQYRNLMKKHYQDITYQIKDAVENGDQATVTVEIEVYDYSKTIAATNLYFNEHPQEFLNANNETDIAKYNDYRLSELKKVTDRVKYTLDLTLTKTNDKWQMNPIDEVTEDKIHGIYIY